MSVLPQLLTNNSLISDQMNRPALETVLRQLERVLQSGTPGDIAEFGCYIGTTSLFIRRLMDAMHETDQRMFHAYDSFAGLPSKGVQDQTTVGDDFRAGELSVSRKQLQAEFHKAHLQLPIIHKAWFSELSSIDVPEHIAFAFLDGDFYSSMIDSLRLVWPRLSVGGAICIDDYQRETLPGVERAVRDFFQDKPQRITVAHNIATIIKL